MVIRLIAISRAHAGALLQTQRRMLNGDGVS
jgi:hypothetical protein